jgi:hypothetical protein
LLSLLNAGGVVVISNALFPDPAVPERGPEEEAEDDIGT